MYMKLKSLSSILQKFVLPEGPRLPCHAMKLQSQRKERGRENQSQGGYDFSTNKSVSSCT
jgi:hypothetical protein